MVRGLVLRAGATLAMLSIAGCAHYAKAPLHDASVALAPVDPAWLAQDAARIERPFLKPQTIDLSQPLTPNALAVIAVIENPELKAMRTRLNLDTAQSFAARLLPDPTAQLGYDKLLKGPDEHDGFTGQIGFDLAALRKAGAIREQARANAQKVRLDIAWAEWRTASAAQLQGVRITALEAQLPLLQLSVAQSQRRLEIVNRVFARGDLASPEVETRRQGRIDSGDKLRTAERDLAAARFELNKLLGLAPSSVLKIAPAPFPSLGIGPAALTTLAITQRLDLAALRAGYDSAEADVHKAVLDQFPNLSLTIAAARDTSLNYTLGPQIGFSLPLFNRNRGGIAVARTTREQLRAEYDARLFQTRAEIAAAASLIELSRHQRGELIAQMRPLEQLAATARRAAQRGDITMTAAEATEQSLRDRHLALLQLEQAAAEAWIALELLSGGPSEGWTR